jgi:hypothetical protein
LQDCIKLCDNYHDCYKNMCRQVVESPDEKPFEASEIRIFGQLGIFKMRIIRVSAR